MAMPMGEDAISRGASPMTYFEEFNGDSTQSKKTKLDVTNGVRSPFLIGSIDEVNRRISNLEQHLHGYTDLTAPMGSRDSVYSDNSRHLLCSAKARERYQKKEKENMEVNQFAGIYTIKSTFSHRTSERAKNISKISMTSKPAAAVVPSSTGKPRFVELQQYPGFTENEMTHLPYEKSVTEILSKVVSAQPKISSMSAYKELFEKWFFAKCSQDIVQDVFWWIFLHKWQTVTDDQATYFNRISFNYVRLMSLADHPQFRQRFLGNYPMLLSQAVYAAYCESFPNSYRQFTGDFKEDIIRIVHEWMTGICPMPRLWLKWNVHKLEPDGIRNSEELHGKNKKKSRKSQMYLKLLNSQTSEPFNTASQSSSIPIDVSKQAKGTVVTVPEGQLTPIRESGGIDKKVKKQIEGRVRKHRNRSVSESHPVGRGAEFVKRVFNVNGQSPLVAHYLHQEKCRVEAGVCHRVQRTEVTSLPPYRDVARESIEKQKIINEKTKRLYKEGEQAHVEFLKKEAAQRLELNRRQTLLLSNKKVIKQLADIIMLEGKKDDDSVSAQMTAAIDRALLA